MRRLRSFAADRNGTVAILTATAGALVVAGCAFAIDMGYVFTQGRKLQGMADLAAMAAARDLEQAQAATKASVQANSWADGAVDFSVATGTYQATKAKAVAQRFVAGGATPNVAQVELTADADLFFAKAILGKQTVKLTRRATAARAQFASFSIGTRLASLNGGIGNSLLSALTGGSVSLSVADYNALAGAKVDLFDYASALRTSASLQGASYDETLSSSISTGQAMSVLGDVLAADGQTQAGSAAKKVAVGAGGLGAIKLSSVFDLGPSGAQDKVLRVKQTAVSMTAADVADALLLVAQEGRQVKLDLGAGVPGVADLDVWLAIGERPNNSPWMAMDDDGDVIIRTNQARLYVEAKTSVALPLVGSKLARLPILVEIASGEAKISAINCPVNAAANKVTLDVRPSLGKVVVADIDTDKLNDFKHDLVTAPATIVDLAVVKVAGSGEVKLGGDAWQKVDFSNAEIAAGAVKSVKTADIAQAALSNLIAHTSVSAKVLGVSTPALGLSILSTLSPLAAPLDSTINGLTELLGVRLGEADVQINGLRCRDAALVA